MTLVAIPKQVYDVFLSHHHFDKPTIEILARNLKKCGLNPWLDKWNLIPGTPWQPAIERALSKCRTCAIFLGRQGSGPWQIEEMRAAIERRVRTTKGTFRVIPVLLPGASATVNGLSTFLGATTWVEFRNTIEDKDAFQRLLCGIRGVEPGDISSAISSEQESRMKVEIHLTGSTKQFSQVAKAAEEFLQKASGDTTLSIRYIKKGSVVLGIDCSASGWRKLLSIFENGQMPTLLGYVVESLDATSSDPSKLDKGGQTAVSIQEPFTSEISQAYFHHIEAVIAEMQRVSVPYSEAVREFRREFARTMVRQNEGNLTKVALELGIHRSTLGRFIAEVVNDARRRQGNCSRLLSALVETMHSSGVLYEDAVSAFQQRFLITVLQQNKGNLTKAARELGIHRSTLSRAVAGKITTKRLQDRKSMRNEPSQFPGDQARKWFVVDASGQTLGRLASRVASILAGKESPLYTPFIDAGDHVIVINADKVRVTGMKTEQKVYRHYTGFPGGLRDEQFHKLFDRRPDRVVQEAILAMLPKNKAGRAMGKKLKVYVGDKQQYKAERESEVTAHFGHGRRVFKL